MNEKFWVMEQMMTKLLQKLILSIRLHPSMNRSVLPSMFFHMCTAGLQWQVVSRQREPSQSLLLAGMTYVGH